MKKQTKNRPIGTPSRNALAFNPARPIPMTISKVYHCNFRLSPILMGYLQTWVTCFLDGRSDSIQPRQRSL